MYFFLIVNFPFGPFKLFVSLLRTSTFPFISNTFTFASWSLTLNSCLKVFVWQSQHLGYPQVDICWLSFLLRIGQFSWLFICGVILDCILDILNTVLFRVWVLLESSGTYWLLGCFSGSRPGTAQTASSALPLWVVVPVSGFAVLIWVWDVCAQRRREPRLWYGLISRIRHPFSSPLLSRILPTASDSQGPLFWCSGQKDGVPRSFSGPPATAQFCDEGCPWGTARRRKRREKMGISPHTHSLDLRHTFPQALCPERQFPWEF